MTQEVFNLIATVVVSIIGLSAVFMSAAIMYVGLVMLKLKDITNIEKDVNSQDDQMKQLILIMKELIVNQKQHLSYGKSCFDDISKKINDKII